MFEAAPNDEILEYGTELSQLMDALQVCEEIREGCYSDESLIMDLFDRVATDDEIEAALQQLALPSVSPSARIVDVLREMRRLKTLQ